MFLNPFMSFHLRPRVFAPLLLAWLSGVSVQAAAETARLIVAQPLRAEPRVEAAAVARLAQDVAVQRLASRNGWEKVRAGNLEGWLRRLALDLQPQETTSLAGQLGAFIQSVPQDMPHPEVAVVAVAGMREVPLARPSAHALIITNSAYKGEIKPLPGTRQDRESAVLIARALGVPAANTVQAEDVDLPALRLALDSLEQRIRQNDEIFLYYSGHGGRTVAWDGRADRCAEALVTIDGQALFDHELAERLDRIAVKARRVVMLIDACHSGGVTTRTVSAGGVSGTGQLTGKYWAKGGAKGEETGATEVCTRPVNVLTRSLGSAKPGEGRLNHVYIAAANNDEVALDDSERGGLATQAWLECLGGAARDADGSAGLSVRELQACAQPVIERLVKDNRFRPHHIKVTGNADMWLAPASDANGGTVASPVALPQPEVKPDLKPVEPNAVATLRELYANRDDRRVVKLTPDRAGYRIGQDRVRFSLSSSHAGYVYLLMVGSDGTSFDLLFPNARDTNNRIQAGEVLNLPRPGWGIRPGGPAGQDTVLAVVSDTPRDYAGIGMKPAGPFSVLGASSTSTRDIQLVSATSANARNPACAEMGARRTLEVVEACSDAYGADLVRIEELP